MIPCLYASTKVKFDHNGIGKLADAQSCIVTEKRNGSFELEMVYPADGKQAPRGCPAGSSQTGSNESSCQTERKGSK